MQAWAAESGDLPRLTAELEAATDALVVLGGDGTFLRAARAVAARPSGRAAAAGGGGTGVLPSVTRPFCRGCTGARLSADGKLYPCLFAGTGHDLRGRAADLSYWEITLLSAVGATIGSLLVILLRRAYIVEERLPFPEGVACAQVLRAGDAGGAAARPLIAGGAIVLNTGGVSTLFHFAQPLVETTSASGDAAAQRVNRRRETGVSSIIPSLCELSE